VEELGTDFVGRGWLAKALLLDLEKIDPRIFKQFVVIYGESGTGKSTFITRLFDPMFCQQQGGAWESLHQRVLARHVCRVQDTETLDPLKWAQSLAGQIFLAVSGADKMKDALAIGGHLDRQSFADWLEKQDSVRKILNEWVLPLLSSFGSAQELKGLDTIVVDSLDEAQTQNIINGTSRDTIVSYLVEFRTKWPSWISFLATSRPDPATKKVLLPLTGASIDVKDPQNLKDIRAFVLHGLERGFRLVGPRDTNWTTNQLLARVLQCHALNQLLDVSSRKVLATAPMCRNWQLWQPGTVDQICDKANGVFMYAQEVLKQLNDDPFLDLDSLPVKLAALYMERYKKTFPKGTLVRFKKHSYPMLNVFEHGCKTYIRQPTTIPRYMGL
jgi:hypothetical protein